MLQSLRNLKPETKKKLVLTVASTLTFFVFIFWIFTFSGTFINSLSDTSTKVASVYSAFEQNIEKVYNTITKMVPKDIANIKNGNTYILQNTATTTSGI